MRGVCTKDGILIFLATLTRRICFSLPSLLSIRSRTFFFVPLSLQLILNCVGRPAEKKLTKWESEWVSESERVTESERKREKNTESGFRHNQRNFFFLSSLLFLLCLLVLLFFFSCWLYWFTFLSFIHSFLLFFFSFFHIIYKCCFLIVFLFYCYNIVLYIWVFYFHFDKNPVICPHSLCLNFSLKIETIVESSWIKSRSIKNKRKKERKNFVQLLTKICLPK